jgi:hypothetical protein
VVNAVECLWTGRDTTTADRSQKPRLPAHFHLRQGLSLSLRISRCELLTDFYPVLSILLVLVSRILPPFFQ